jgi:hypothetical protein
VAKMVYYQKLEGQKQNVKILEWQKLPFSSAYDLKANYKADFRSRFGAFSIGAFPICTLAPQVDETN